MLFSNPQGCVLHCWMRSELPTFAHPSNRPAFVPSHIGFIALDYSSWDDEKKEQVYGYTIGGDFANYITEMDWEKIARLAYEADNQPII